MAGSSAQLVTSCIELADRIRPPLLPLLHHCMYPGTPGTVVHCSRLPRGDARTTCPFCKVFGESSQPASQSSSRLQTLVFFLNPHPHPSVARPTQGSRSLPSRPEFPACLASSHPSTSSATAFPCLDRFSFDVNRTGTRLFLMNLSFLFF